jgi:hypothetical protein
MEISFDSGSDDREISGGQQFQRFARLCGVLGRFVKGDVDSLSPQDL